MGEPLRLLGLKDVAELLGTDRENVRAWIESGLLPCIRVGAGGEPRVSVLMLEEWQRRVAAAGQTTSQRASTQAAPGRPRPPLGVVR